MKNPKCLMLTIYNNNNLTTTILLTMTVTEMGPNETREFYLEYFRNQFRLRAEQDGQEIDDDYKDAVLEDWSWRVSEEQAQEHLARHGIVIEVSAGRPDPPIVQEHLQVYLTQISGYTDEEEFEDHGIYSPNHEHYLASVFDLAMNWFAWEAVMGPDNNNQ
jgi:hypothetical protein